MSSKRHSYPSEDLTVEFDSSLCIHAAECVRGLPAVFKPGERPWVDVEQTPVDEVIKVVQRCPTGALQYRRTDGGSEETPAATNNARVIACGPLYVTGDLLLTASDGTQRQESRVALCRCGASKNKPFCDNSHRSVAFEDTAVEMADRLKPGTDQEGLVTLTLATNGPVLIDGPITVSCDDGTQSRGVKGALCRCGQSGQKPYCDGAHRANGFEAK